MEQEYKNICIIGAGAAGCFCAYCLADKNFDITLFDTQAPLKTLLATGGGRCNLAHAEFDFKQLAKNYPRGEKFLYSVFSKFSTAETLEYFEKIGIKTYTQSDGRIFPVTNSAKDVRSKLLTKLNRKNISFIKECVLDITPQSKGFKIKTNKAEYHFTDVVIASGGRWINKIKGINHKIITPKPSLVGLNSNIKSLSGLALNNVYSKDIKESGDLLFTHYGISGPLIYKISSIKVYENFPYNLTFDLYPAELDLQSLFDKNPHKELKNILSEIFPHRFAEYISEKHALTKGCEINGKIRDKIKNSIHNFEITIAGTNKGEETVTAGGYDLNEINAKTMESKLYPDLYFAGEVLDIDGFCGGFNLQNAWSTAFIAANGIINKKEGI